MRTNYFGMLLFLVVLTSCNKESLTVTEADNIESLELDVIKIVNNYRSEIGQSVLAFSEVAYEYASEHNDYMISKGSISHDNFNSRASKIANQVNAELVAENVARNYDSASEAFEGWLNSSSHKKTMEGNFTHTAVSVKMNGDGNYYYTQIFVRQ